MASLEPDDNSKIMLPEVITAQWATMFGKELERASWRGAGALRNAMSVETILKILHKAAIYLKAEPTLLEVIISRARRRPIMV